MFIPQVVPPGCVTRTGVPVPQLTPRNLGCVLACNTRLGELVIDCDERTMDVEFVQGLLDHLEWSWSQLAREMGMSKSTIGRVADYKTLPGRKFIFALFDVFPQYRGELFIPLVEVAERVPAARALLERVMSGEGEREVA